MKSYWSKYDFVQLIIEELEPNFIAFTLTPCFIPQKVLDTQDRKTALQLFQPKLLRLPQSQKEILARGTHSFLLPFPFIISPQKQAAGTLLLAAFQHTHSPPFSRLGGSPPNRLSSCDVWGGKSSQRSGMFAPKLLTETNHVGTPAALCFCYSSVTLLSHYKYFSRCRGN